MIARCLTTIIFEVMIFICVLFVSAQLIDYLSKRKNKRVVLRKGLLKCFFFFQYEIRREIKPQIDYDKHDKNSKKINTISTNAIVYQIIIYMLLLLCLLSCIIKMAYDNPIIDQLYIFSIIITFSYLFVGAIVTVLMVLCMNRIF